MNEKLVMWRFQPPVRIALLCSSGAAVIGVLVLGSSKSTHENFGVACALLLVAFFGLSLGLERVAAHVRLHELDPAERRQALALAWGKPSSQPEALWKWSLAAVGLGMVVYMFSWSPQLSLPLLVGAALLGPLLAAGRWFISAGPWVQKFALRGAGVDYVKTMYPSWLAAGAKRAGEITLERFQQTDPSRAPFVFWLPDFKSSTAPDMPVPFVHFETLSVGEFLGARSGNYIDLKTTSQAHADLAEPETTTVSALALGEDTGKVEEREAHYRDVITVDYKRAQATAGENAPTGVFQVSLANGQTIAFPTLEEGTPVQAALESIRQRTRRAKGAA